MKGLNLDKYDIAISTADMAARIVVVNVLASAEPPTDDDETRARAATHSVRPNPEDYARVFVGEAAAVAHDVYEAAWQSAPSLPLVPPNGRLDVWCRPGIAFSGEPRLTAKFPGGMRAIAKWLKPDPIWVGWRFVWPDGSDKRSEGLVWLDGRFAFFPRPWGVLSKLA